MGQLPAERSTPSPPFIHCRLDYAGPINIKVGSIRSRVTSKAYLAFFVCFSTRVVAEEVVSDLTTTALLAAFRRFISRRGIPTNVYSDNATTFKSAKRELDEMVKFMSFKFNQDQIQEGTAHWSIKWNFIPPRSPHFGGLWEVTIKSFKQRFWRTIRNRILTFEELSTLATEIKAILNSRPLIPLSEEITDLNYLSPGHFITQRPLAIDPLTTEMTPVDHLSRWKRTQARTKQLWEKWSQYYLLSLQRQQKWHSASQNLKIVLLVLIKETNLPPAQWRVGRIVKLYPGRDNRVRVVDVRTGAGLYKRAIHNVCPFPNEE